MKIISLFLLTGVFFTASAHAEHTDHHRSYGERAKQPELGSPLTRVLENLSKSCEAQRPLSALGSGSVRNTGAAGTGSFDARRAANIAFHEELVRWLRFKQETGQFPPRMMEDLIREAQQDLQRIRNQKR